MVADIRFVRELKIRLHKLNLNLPADKETYELILLSFIKANEGERLYVYLDIKKNHTIGIGFNMDSPYVERIWQEIFGYAISFYRVKEGKQPITKDTVTVIIFICQNQQPLRVNNSLPSSVASA